jgi:glycerol transport system permease protein
MKNRAWLFLLPTLVLVAINAFIPMMTVVNYSLFNLYSGSTPEFIGLKNYYDLFRDAFFHSALWRQMIFSIAVLLVEIPLGIMIALCMPKKGIGIAISLVLLGFPLLIPYNVVGIIWRLFTQDNIGIVPTVLAWFGYKYNVAMVPIDAALTIFICDVWHWTPLITLLAFAGMQSIPDAFYQAAKIDGATPWKTFWYVTLPKMRNVLTIGILLRFMDSFKIYDEPMTITGGGPGSTTTFLNIFVARKAESYDLGYAGAVSIVYLLIVMIVSYLFFQVLSRAGKGGAEK